MTKHRTRRPGGKRKKRFIPVMAEKEFSLLSRLAEVSKIEGNPKCEQVRHISLTPSTQEMPMKMRRQKQSRMRQTRNAGLPFLRNKHAFSRHFRLLEENSALFKHVWRLQYSAFFFMIPLPSCNMRSCKKKAAAFNGPHSGPPIFSPH